MVIKFLLIALATFLTCWIYFLTALAGLSAIKVKVKNNDRRRRPY